MPHLVDEWQEVPGIWDAVRFAVDRSSERGCYILTGSTMPSKESRIHSGAGRIESVRMHTTTLFETGASTGSVSLGELLSSRKIETANSQATLDGLIEDAGGQTISKDTVAEYLSAFKRLYVLEEIPAWSPASRSRTRLRRAPKRVLTDPSLAAAALGLTPQKLKDDLKTFGFIFEAMCLRDLAVYAQYLNSTLYHYADETGLDADAIIESADGSWAALEIKLGHNQVDTAATKLLSLEKKLVKADAKPPTCLIVVTGLSSFAYQRKDGVFVVPIDCMKP